MADKVPTNWGGAIEEWCRRLAYGINGVLDGRTNNIGDVTKQVQQLVEASDNASTQFVRQALQGRMRAYRTGKSTVV